MSTEEQTGKQQSQQPMQIDDSQLFEVLGRITLEANLLRKALQQTQAELRSKMVQISMLEKKLATFQDQGTPKASPVVSIEAGQRENSGE